MTSGKLRSQSWVCHPLPQMLLLLPLHNSWDLVYPTSGSTKTFIKLGQLYFMVPFLHQKSLDASSAMRWRLSVLKWDILILPSHMTLPIYIDALLQHASMELGNSALKMAGVLTIMSKIFHSIAIMISFLCRHFYPGAISLVNYGY